MLLSAFLVTRKVTIFEQWIVFSLVLLTSPPSVIREFKMPLRRRNENVKKQLVKISKITTLHVHHVFLYISLPSLHDYDVINCLISRLIDNVNIRRRISLTLCIPGYFS